MNTEMRKYNLTETEKAYIAGFFDGEGYVGITRGGKSSKIRPSFSILNSNKDVIDFIGTKLGVSIKPFIRRGDGFKRRYWRINLSSIVDILCILREIRPYLIVKAEISDLVMQYLEERYETLMKVDNMKKAPHGAEGHRYYMMAREINSKGTGTKLSAEEIE